MRISRRDLFKTGGLATAAAITGSPWLATFAADSPLPFKVGVTDWNIRKEADPVGVELAKRLGFDGVQISLGIGAERLPLADPEMQQRYLEESRKHSLPLASTCLNILHRNYLKNDPLGKRWVADAIPVTKALGMKVILLPFFGKGALREQAERDYVGDVLREIGPEAEKTGVILGLENTNSAEENVGIMERSRSKAVQVYYDIGNSTNNGHDVLKEIRWLGKSRICEIHIKDNPKLLGQGKINLRAVADAILEIGFSEWAVLETSARKEFFEQDLTYNLGYTRALFNKA